ncbi:hypothetical protein M9458_051616, partial [Cirrhinus mrigala]
FRDRTRSGVLRVVWPELFKQDTPTAAQHGSTRNDTRPGLQQDTNSPLSPSS